MAAATVAAGFAIGSAIYGAISQHKAGQAAQAAANSDAQRLDFNAQVADLQAQDATQRGAEEEQRFRTSVRGLIATQRTGFAGQNVDISSGSAVDVQADSAYLGELDARKIRANAQREAWGFGVQAEDLRQSAEVARKGGAASARAANYQAAGTLLGTTSSLLMSRYGWDRNVQVSRSA